MKAPKNDLLEVIAMRQKKKKISSTELDVISFSTSIILIFEKEFDRWTTMKFFELGSDLLIGKDF
jgi:hypothetical protein